MALLPGLNEHVQSIVLVEPSAAMLATAAQELESRAIEHRIFNTTAQEFVTTQPDLAVDLAQATFSLQNLDRGERALVFEWLRRNAKTALVAEFDVPDFASAAASARVEYVVDRYERGLAEYAGDGGLVAQGFLMPILFGYFDLHRSTHEQPIAAWEMELRHAGFARIEKRLLDEYWWAPAYLLRAEG
jgi:hypothetical protein